jgi:hypothetical protein
MVKTRKKVVRKRRPIKLENFTSMTRLLEHTGLDKVYCTFRTYELVAERVENGLLIHKV